MLQFGRISAHQTSFSVVNAVGALFIILSLLLDSFNLASFVVESFWLLVSIIGIVRSFRSRSGESTGS